MGVLRETTPHFVVGTNGAPRRVIRKRFGVKDALGGASEFTPPPAGWDQIATPIPPGLSNLQ
jgi:hypothetical protein